MFDFILNVFDTNGFPPRWQCGTWSAAHGWTHILSDLAIFGAYTAIPLALTYFVLRRREVPFLPIFWLFVAFILFCGVGHLVEATLFWHPWYRFSGAIKVCTAVVSWVTVLALLPVLPKALALPGLAAVNARLGAEVQERRRAEASLQRSEEQTRRLIEAAPNAIVMIDSSGQIVLVNAEAERLFGYSRDELLGQQIEVVVPERFRSQHPAMRASFFELPQTRRMGAGRDLYALRKDGSEFPVEIGLNPVETAEGLFVLSAIVDITERKRLEGTLRTMNQELEQRVAARTAQLEAVNGALLVEIGERQRAEELIRDSLRVKEVLLREIHHRVKNNLAVISSIFYLQSTYARDAETIKMFQETQDRVRSMALVHESLYRSDDLGAVHFGKYARSLARHLLDTYRLPSATVALRMDVEDVVLSIDTAIPCGLILNELISNCLKHAFPEGDGEIVLSLHGEPGGKCVLRVCDSGVGIPGGLDLQQVQSLGMRLVRSLTAQISGTFTVRGSSRGTEA